MAPGRLSVQTYDTVHAPPATVFLHALQVQIPTECLLTVFLPQKLHANLLLEPFGGQLRDFSKAHCIWNAVKFPSSSPVFSKMHHICRSIRISFRKQHGTASVRDFEGISTECRIYRSHRPLERKAISDQKMTDRGCTYSWFAWSF